MPESPAQDPTPGRRSLRFVAPAFLLGAAVLLAACGSSGSTASTPSTTKAASGSGTPAPATVVVKSASNPQLGSILVDSSGRTLYTLTNNGAAVACTGSCLTAWPPLVLPSGITTASGGSGVTGLTVVAAGGGQQVAEKGLPLYRFAGDSAAGDAKGDGLNSFGGTWHVVTVSGSGTNTDSTSTTKKSSSYGSGY